MDKLFLSATLLIQQKLTRILHLVFCSRTQQLMFCLGVLLGFNELKAQQSTLCLTTGGSQLANGPVTSPPGFNGSNSYTLRLYFHIVQKTNGTGGQPVDSIPIMLGWLNADFNPHNIYFIQDCPVNFIKNDYLYTFGSLCDFSGYIHDDGIDIFLKPDEATFAGGLANGIPSDYLVVSGSHMFLDSVIYSIP